MNKGEVRQVIEMPMKYFEEMKEEIHIMKLLLKQLQEERKNTLPELMTIKEVQEYFSTNSINLSRGALLNWYKDGTLNRTKVGGKVLYRKSDVAALFEKTA